MLRLIDYGLKKNPFTTVPTDVDHWSGRDRERDLLHDVYQSVLYGDSGLSEFVIIVGEWGSGKTHALEFFRQFVNVQRPDMEAKAILVPKVKLGPKVSWLELYRHIVKQHLGREFFRDLATRFRDLVTTCADELSNAVDRATLQRSMKEDPEHFRKKVVSELAPEDQPYAMLLLYVAEGSEAALTYLTEGVKGPSNIDLPKDIKNDYNAVQILAGIFRVMTLPIQKKPPVYRGVHFAIDEVEELLEVKATEQAEFWFGTRELINRVPERMAFLLSFSTDVPMLEAIISDAVYDRTTRKNVALEAFSSEDGKEFVRRQLEYCRPADYDAPQPFHPFTADAVDYVLEQTVSLVPRKIFLPLRQVLERAIRREGLEKGDEIDRALAEAIMLKMGI